MARFHFNLSSFGGQHTSAAVVSQRTLRALRLDEAGEPRDAPQGPGWFESSWDLQQGLMVNELSDRDGAAAALWFSALDNSTAVRDSAWASARHPGCAASAQLQ